MGNARIQYKLLLRVGDKVGTFERAGNKPILTLGEAHAYAREVEPQVHEVIIMKQEVVARIKGGLAPEELKDGDA